MLMGVTAVDTDMGRDMWFLFCLHKTYTVYLNFKCILAFYET